MDGPFYTFPPQTQARLLSLRAHPISAPGRPSLRAGTGSPPPLRGRVAGAALPAPAWRADGDGDEARPQPLPRGRPAVGAGGWN